MAQWYYEAGLYKGKRWAVISYPSCVWYFQKENTKEAAEKYAYFLNTEAI